MLLPLTTAQIFINTGAKLLRSMICCDFGYKIPLHRGHGLVFVTFILNCI